MAHDLPDYAAVNLGYRMPPLDPEIPLPMTGFGMTLLGPDGSTFPVMFSVEQAIEIRRRIDRCIPRNV